MKQEFEELYDSLKSSDIKKYRRILSKHKHLKDVLKKRYGTHYFKDVKLMIDFVDQRNNQCPKCGSPVIPKCKCKIRNILNYISYRSLRRYLQRYDNKKILDVFIKRTPNQQTIGLTKEEIALIKLKKLQVNRCQCGRLKPVEKQVCLHCNKILKAQETIREKYGVDNISQLEEIKQKKIKKWKQNQDKWVEKHRQAVLKKYGVDNVSKLPEVKKRKAEKLRKTRKDFNKYCEVMNKNFSKYGKFNTRWEVPVDILHRIKDSPNPFESYIRILYHERLEVDDRCELITSFDEFVTHLIPRKVSVRCKECERISTFSMWSTNKLYLSCKYCNAYTSIAERTLYNWLQKHGVDCLVHHNRGTKDGEIDIFIPQYNLGIEVQGLAWHAIDEAYKRDKEKWSTYTNKGVRLFYAYEDDLNMRQTIVRSMLAHKLNMLQLQQVVYARKTNLHVSHKVNDDIKQFFEDNHIHGFASGSLYLVLVHEDEIVAGMILGKSRFSKDKTTNEIVRFCTKTFTHVPGAFSKLYKHAYSILKPDQIIFYVDSAFGSNLEEDISNRYSTLDVKDIQLLQPSFYVVDLNEPYVKYHRLHASKDSLARYVDVDASQYTQDELLKLAGFGKLFRPPSWRITLS